MPSVLAIVPKPVEAFVSVAFAVAVRVESGKPTAERLYHLVIPYRVASGCFGFIRVITFN